MVAIPQPRNFGTDSEHQFEDPMKVLKFRKRLEALRWTKRLKVRELAQMAGIDRDRFEDIYEGTHAPAAADVIRMQRGLDIQFDPEEFEEYGL